MSALTLNPVAIMTPCKCSLAAYHSCILKVNISINKDD